MLDYNSYLKRRPLLYCFIAYTLISCEFSSEEKKRTNSAVNNLSYVNQSELDKSIERGAEIYTDFCVTCHRPAGDGIDGSFPPLAGSDYLMNNRIESIKAVKYGQQGEIVVNGSTYNSVMAALGLDDEEVADVLNYAMNSWGNEQDKMITTQEVTAVRK